VCSNPIETEIEVIQRSAVHQRFRKCHLCGTCDFGEIQERPSNNTGGDHQRNLSFFSTFPSTGCTRRFYNLKFCSPQVNQKIKKSHEVNQSNWSAHANSCYSWASKNTICTTWAEEYSCCTVVDSP
jgi:hypothetical protein